MNAHQLLLAAALSPLFGGAARGAEPNNGWTPKFFAYEPERKMMVAERTPTAAQVDWRQRPPQVKRKAADLKPAAGPAKARTVGPLDIVHLEYVDADGDVVPALLATPAGKTGPFPVVIATHGLTSNKAQVVAQIGPELAKRGFAVLAPDMPRHGERPGDPRTILDRTNLVESFRLAREAVIDVRQCIDLAERRPELDTRAGVILAGYSMGSWINAVVGPSDPRVKAMVLMVGGAHEIPPAALMIPQVAATDPRLALSHFAGRPLLMLNAKQDYVVTPEMGRRLFAAAAEPKEQIWYDCGHLLSDEAYAKAADWIAETAAKISAEAEPAKRAG